VTAPTHPLAGRHVVVFGGSSGIGLAVARAAVSAGADVSILARSADRLGRAAAALGGVRAVRVDVRDTASVAAAAEALPDPDHVFVSSASFVGGPLLELGIDDARSALDARVWGTVDIVRALAPRMQGPAASFVLTGGISTDRPVKGAWATSIATAATEQLARCIAVELAPLRCNAIAPGWTDTPMWDAVLGADKAAAFAATAGRIPVGRIARPEEAAAAAIALMVTESINGEVLHVDGGHRLA
jgi:NAD(P)-dependent dehydrogenase (short-subunit alcohol dehydrogenase family)